MRLFTKRSAVGIRIDGAGENHNALDQAPQAADSAGAYGNNDLDHSLAGKSEIEVMYAPCTQEDSKKSCYHLGLGRIHCHIGIIVRLLITLLIGLLCLLIRLLCLLIRLLCLLIGLLCLLIGLLSLLIGLLSLLEGLLSLLEGLLCLLEGLLRLLEGLLRLLDFRLSVNRLCFLRSCLYRHAAGGTNREMIAKNISTVFTGIIHNYSSFQINL